MMRIKTTRFGEIEVPETEIFTFVEGLLGFPEVQKFILLENPKGGPFRWIQSVEVAALAFVVADPAQFFPDYRVRIRPEDLVQMGLADVSAGVVLVILTIPRDPREITANLQGPLVLNREKKLARQLVLAEAGITTRHRIFGEAK